MSAWSAVIHLPGLSTTGDRDQLAGGQLAYLDFDAWYAIDGSHGYAQSKYEATRPLFWIGTLSAPDTVGIEQVLVDKARDLHRLLLLHPIAPALASPGLSCLYASSETDIGRVWCRIIGSAEREWIVFGGVPTAHFDDRDLGLLDDVQALLDAVPAGRQPPALRAAVDVLERTARPEYQFALDDPVDGLGGFVEAVAACEGLVSDDGEQEDSSESLTSAFARKTAALFAPDDVAQHGLVKNFGEIYALRSRLIHGRLRAEDLGEEQVAKILAGRRFLRNCCVAALSKLDVQ